MRAVAVVQARTASTRLPGKVLADVAGEPLLARLLQRLRRARSVDDAIVATSDGAEDDAVAEAALRCGAGLHRGSRDDVLDRFAGAVRAAGAATAVRITADCPLLDPALVDRAVSEHGAGAFDYTSTALPGARTFPDGLDVEVVEASVLESARREARLPSEREHVTPWIWTRPQRFRLHAVRGERDLSHLRWTVDVPEDLQLVREVFAELLPAQPDFGTADVLALLERRPELARLNAHVARNEGYARSLERDAAVGEGLEAGA